MDIALDIFNRPPSRSAVDDHFPLISLRLRRCLRQSQEVSQSQAFPRSGHAKCMKIRPQLLKTPSPYLLMILRQLVNVSQSQAFFRCPCDRDNKGRPSAQECRQKMPDLANERM
jgi:hypothetical protein